MPGSHQLNFRSVYMQVRDIILESIFRGEWRAGQMIPNESDLATRFNVSVGTIRKALETLELDQVIVRKQGRGTFIVDPDAPECRLRFNGFRDARGRLVPVEAMLTEKSQSAANKLAQERLQIGSRQEVINLHYVMSVQGRPVMLEHVCLPAERFPDIDVSPTEPLNLFVLGRKNGILVDHAREVISFETSDTTSASRFCMSAGLPLWKFDRTTFDIDDRPIELRSGLRLADGVTYHAELTLR